MQSYFPTGQIFFHAPKIFMVSEFHCPKRGKNNSNFRIVNLSNSGTKDFVELWEIRHLNIWTQLT